MRIRPRIKGNPKFPVPGIEPHKPVWMRISDVRYSYGISRTEIFRLKGLVEIETKMLVKPGKSRGICWSVSQVWKRILTSSTIPVCGKTDHSSGSEPAARGCTRVPVFVHYAAFWPNLLKTA
jgi:hypothetical protein